MQHQTQHHRQKPQLHQNSNGRRIVYDPGGISNDSTFSGATQASSDDITGHSDTPLTHPPLPFNDANNADDTDCIHICSYTGNAARFDTGISSISDHRFVHDPGREDFNGSIKDTSAHNDDTDCSSDSHIVCDPAALVSARTAPSAASMTATAAASHTIPVATHSSTANAS